MRDQGNCRPVLADKQAEICPQQPQKAPRPRLPQGRAPHSGAGGAGKGWLGHLGWCILLGPLLPGCGGADAEAPAPAVQAPKKVVAKSAEKAAPTGQPAEFDFEAAEDHEVKEYHSNGLVMRTRHVKQGPDGTQVNHGPMTVFSRFGKKVEEVHFHQGLRHGVATRWYESGQKRAEVQYHYDQRHGPYKIWGIDNKPLVDAHFERGLKHGKCRVWYTNGQLAVQAHYKHGLLRGTVEKWYPDGQRCLQAEATGYSGLRQCQSWKYWDPSGRLRGELERTDSQIELTLKTIDDDILWKLTRDLQSDDASEDLWYPSGQKAAHLVFSAGQPSEESRCWDQEGEELPFTNYYTNQQIEMLRFQVATLQEQIGAVTWQGFGIDARDFNRIELQALVPTASTQR